MKESKYTITHNALVSALIAVGLCLSFVAHAETQSLKATIDGKVFESDDDGITLVPVARSFSLSAITKGFSNYPSPPGLSDRLAIACRNFDGKAVKYTADDFAYGRCNASFAKGQSKQPFGKDEALFEVSNKTVSPKTMIEITKASGKVIEGRFVLEMIEEGKSRKVNVEGTFKAEDRQK
jgi:hypothetical protein